MRPHRIRVAILGMGLALGLTQVGSAQFGPPSRPAAQPDVNNLSHQMAERVRHLGEDIDSDLGRTPQGRHLLQDIEELAQATDEFHDALHNARDPFQKRQAYTGIHQTWYHLRDQLARPGISTPAVDRAARRVDELDAQIQQALGLRGDPRAIPARPPARQAPQPAINLGQTQRLSYTLVQRVEYLQATIQAEAANLPNGARFARQADQLSQACGTFYDSLGQNHDLEDFQQSFTSVTTIADRLGAELRAVRCPPRVEQGWQSFAATDVLIRGQLNLPAPPPPGVRVILRPARGPSPLVAMTDQLVQQVDVFIQVFATTARDVPQGQYILADAQRLQAAAADFRQDIARGPQIDPNVLADEFEDVDACWQRLVRRVNRVGGGRTGPNIQQVQKMGATCEQIHTVLGMPGYPPTVIGAPHDHDHDHPERNR